MQYNGEVKENSRSYFYLFIYFFIVAYYKWVKGKKNSKNHKNMIKKSL